MRNPWGEGEWTGNWSDKSPNWTDDLKRQVGFTEKNDGYFFIEEKDYVENFRSTCICMYVDDYYKTYAEATTAKGEGKLFKFTLEDQADQISLQASQLTDRLTQCTKGTTISMSRIVVAKLLDGKKYEFIGGDIEIFGSDAAVFLPKGLAAGDYVAYVEWIWTDETKQNNGRFTIYGAEEDYEIEEYEDPEFLQKVMANCMQKNNLVQNATNKIPGFKNANDNEAPGCGIYVSHWDNGSSKNI